MDFAEYLREYHDLTLDDVTPTSIPGVWEVNPTPDDAPVMERWKRQYQAFDGVLHARTIEYHDYPRDSQGRWASPYRTWQAARNERDVV